jgi:hypothetical protein
MLGIGMAVVEYVPAHCTQTGRGFVYWPPAV